MSPRSWRWLSALAILAVALIGVAGSINIPGVSKIVHPRVECQDSPACRAFVSEQIRAAVKPLRKELAKRAHVAQHAHKHPARKGVVPQSSAPPSQPSGGGAPGTQPPGHSPSPPPAPPANAGPPSPPPHKPSPPPPAKPPGLLDPVLHPVCHLTPLGVRICS